MDRRLDVLKALVRDERTREEIAQSLGPNTLRDVRMAAAACCGAGWITQTGERERTRDRLLRLTDAGRERLAEGRV